MSRDFHVLRSLMREFQRLQSPAGTEESKRKSDMLRVEIEKLSRRLETSGDGLNPEEQRILGEARTNNDKADRSHR